MQEYKEKKQPERQELPNDRMGLIIARAWEEQEEIGWEQLVKGRISKKWGMAQNIYYQSHPDLRNQKRYSQKSWEKRTIKSLVEISLGLWKDRCEILHRQENVDKNQNREKINCLGQRML